MLVSVVITSLLAGCKMPAFDVVLIRPIYGWEDGCTPVTITGRGFGEDVSASFGSAPLESPSLPDAATHPLDVGYAIYGLSPAGAGGTYADVSVTTGGQTASITKAFRYVACPAPAYVEGASAGAVAAGDSVSLYGCALDSAANRARVGGQDIPLSAECRTAQVSFTAPSLPDGAYYISVVDAQGVELFPASGCDVTLDPSVDQSVSYDTAVYDPCAAVPVLVYGGAK